MVMKILTVTIVIACTLGHLFASGGGRTNEVREYRRANEQRILREFIDLLSVPNVASDEKNIRRNAELIMEMMRRRGVEPRLLEAPDGHSPPVVYGELKVPGATRTLVLYAHYDGQPANAAEWQGSQPWQPVLRSASLEDGGRIMPLPAAGEQLNPEWRLYARSAADDKARRVRDPNRA